MLMTHRFNKMMTKYLVREDGAAAIEFAFIMPLLLLLYFGLVDVTSLISTNRRIVSAAATMADLVGQQKTNIVQATMNDQFNAVYVIMQPVTKDNVRIEVFGFRKEGAVINRKWKKSNGLGPSCGLADPDTTTMANLMTAGNDVIVARTCMTFTPAVATFAGTNILGSTTINLKQTISVRPRSSLTLTCTDCTP